MDDGFGADITISGKTVLQHQSSFTQAPVEQDTVDAPTVLSPDNDASVGDDAASTSFTSLHELQTLSIKVQGTTGCDGDS
eukprot:5252480-Pleurochrysis_carterae.AAC.1